MWLQPAFGYLQVRSHKVFDVVDRILDEIEEKILYEINTKASPKFRRKMNFETRYHETFDCMNEIINSWLFVTRWSRSSFNGY